jgi:very-short-patch-repair endonuclease
VDAVAKLLLGQKNIATRQQLRAAGLSRSAIRWKLDRGQWQQIHPGVVAAFTGAPTRQQEIIAAGLYAGQDGQIAGLTALELHGFRYAPPDRAIHLLVPSTRRIASRPTVRIARTDRLDQQSWSNGSGPRICSPARAVIDALKGHKDKRTVRAVVAEAVQKRHATIAHIAHELAMAQRNGTALIRQVLAEVADGARSAPEAELRQLTARSKLLPRISWNPRMPNGLPTPDGYLEEADLALEVDSREFHLAPDDWERTLIHLNKLTMAGIHVLRFTPQQIRDHPDEVLRTIEKTYRDRVRRRPPRPPSAAP